MKQVRFIFWLAFIMTANDLYAMGSPTIKHVRTGLHPIRQFMNHKDWSFVENMGQLFSPEIKYYGHQGGVYLYCKPGMVSFVFTENKNIENFSEATGTLSTAAYPSLIGGGGRGRKGGASPQNSEMTTSRADLVLLNSNPSAKILASDQQEYYENFYTTPNANHGITNVHTYKTITYKDIYPYIDLILHTKESGMKYEFVVYPGGKASNIQMQWDGLQEMAMTDSGGIEYLLSNGEMEENNPVSYQGNRVITCSFLKSHNRTGFKIDKYDKTKPLIIDPTLVWGTYFGVGSSSQGIKIDKSGSVFITGNTGSSGIIATTSAFQTSYGGGLSDAFLAKFNGTGMPLWATYYGGSGEDGATAIALDKHGGIYITGSTPSGSGIATNGAFQTNFGGYYDAFLAKFSDSGLLAWATYYGGNNQEIGNGVATDTLGNVYITGETESESGIATRGAYQSSFTGVVNAFLAKFNANGMREWATYYGGSSGGAAMGVSTDSSGNVYITGYTYSSSGIATTGAFQTSFGGNSPAFLAKFNGSGNIQWATYYGRSGYNGLNMIVNTDNFGNVYISGTTSDTGLATGGAYLTTPSAGFLVKFNNSGTRKWATYYPAVVDGITTDGSGNVYITGFTAISSLATGGAYQRSVAGGTDAILTKFNGNGNIQLATYYGGPGNDEGHGIAVDDSGNIYITGVTQSLLGVATKGAYQPYNNGGYTAFLAKFGYRVHDAGIDSFIAPIGNGCMDTLPVWVRLKNYGLAELDSVKIFFSINGKLDSSYSWTGKLLTDSSVAVNLGNFVFLPDTNTLRSWTYNPDGVLDSFPANDTSIAVINISPLLVANAGPDTTLCYDETYTMQGSGGINYTWRPATYLSSANDPNATAVLPNTEEYELIVSNMAGCVDSANVLLKVRPRLKVKAVGNNISVCYGQNVVLSAKAQGGDSLQYNYQWVTDSLMGDSVTKKVYASGWHKVVLSDNCTPASATDSIYVTVTPPAKAAFIYTPATKVETHHNVSFINQSSNASSYLWSFGTHDSSKETSPAYIYTDTGDYKITLVAYGLNNCPNDTAYGFIKIISDELTIYIPNAFSPNGDGTNDFFDITGVGIKSYSYDIYNRWGECIYSSPLERSGEAGWDGTYKGAQVPEGIYIYTLDVTGVDGWHHYMNGNVTLMR